MPKKTPVRIIDNRKANRATTVAGVTLSAPATGVSDHGLLLGLEGDDHPQYLLADGSRALSGDLAVGVGVTIDDVDLSAHAADPAAHHAAVTAGDGIGVTGQQVSLASTVAGAGLGYSAGVLSVGAGTLLTVGADTVGIAAGAAYQFVGTGAGTAAGWRNVSELAGNGLTAANGVLGVGVSGLGLSVAADAVTLTSSSNPGAAASVLASSAAGELTLPTLNGTTKVRAPLIDTATGDLALAPATGITSLSALHASTRLRTPLLDTETGNMTIAPAADLVLSPGSNLVRLAANRALQSDNYASQATGMRISYAGEGDFRYLFTDELHAKSFIADLEQALAGGQIISKSVAVLALAFTLPAAGATGTLRVRDLPSAPNMAVFQSGDYVGLRQFSRAAGSLTIGWAWGTVTAYTDQSDGTQTWTFTRHASTPGAASGTVAADSLVLDFGTSGNGFYEVNAIDGTYAQNSPYWRVVTWATHPATQTVRVQGGNLRGLFGVANEFGFYAGDGTATASTYIRLSNQANEFRNLTATWYNGGIMSAQISPDTGIWVAASLGYAARNGYSFRDWESNQIGGFWCKRDAYLEQNYPVVEQVIGANIKISTLGAWQSVLPIAFSKLYLTAQGKGTGHAGLVQMQAMADGASDAWISVRTGTYEAGGRTIGLNADSIVVSGALNINSNIAAGTYFLDVIAGSGAARDILRASVAGVTNGLTVQYTGSEMKYVFSSGNVGIGTSSPLALQHIHWGGSVNEARTLLHLSTINGYQQYGARLQIVRGTSLAQRWRFIATKDSDGSDIEVLNLTETGVGIGTSSPSKKLHVAGTVVIDGDEGGVAGTVGLTDVSDATLGTGAGTVKLKGTTERNNAGFIKMYVGTTAVWVPYWTSIS